MNRSFNYQTIVHRGHPAFVLVHWEDWNRIEHILKMEKARALGIPLQVVEVHVNNNASLIKAWREYLCLTQKELAERMGISQAAVAKPTPLSCSLQRFHCDYRNRNAFHH